MIDKIERNILIAIFVIIACIGVIMYTLQVIKKPNENNKIVIENATGSKDENVEKEETNKDNNVENKKEIIEEINTTSELIMDYSNRENLYNTSKLIVYGKIIEKNNVEYLKNIEYPFTNAVIEVSEVIKGTLPLDSELGMTDLKNKQKLNFKVPGGEVTLNQYINAMIDKNPEEIAKKGYDKLSKEEKENKYIKINYEYSNPFEKEEYYIIFLNMIENNYFVPAYTCMIPVEKTDEKITKEFITNLPEVIKK